MTEIRQAVFGDLEPLLALYEAAEVSRVVASSDAAETIWRELLSASHVDVFVVRVDDRILATCTLITAANLLRGGRRHGFLENVVAHPDLRNRGYGTAVVCAALQRAWALDCFHVLLQSGRTDPRVHRFYERCGFTPGLRIGHVAQRP